MASGYKEGGTVDYCVPRSVSVKTMNDSDVSSWINTLIGSCGGCITPDSRRNLLQKYLQKQEAGASIVPRPLSSRVDALPPEEVCLLLLDQIGSFAECKNEQSQRNLLKTYLLKKELEGRGELMDYTHRRSRDPLDYEVEHGSDVFDESSKMGQGELTDCTHQRSRDPLDYEVEHGSDVLDESSKVTFHEDDFRQEAKCLESMNYLEAGQLLKDLGMDVTTDHEKDRLRLKQRLFSGQWDDSRGKKMRGMLDKTMKAYKDEKEKLISCCADIIDITSDVSFKTEMSKTTECRFPQFRDELQSTITFLQTLPDKFEIVFTGETSSGKSTFLNVLLEENILPSHLLHTTACLFRLHNSKGRRIEYTDIYGTRWKIPLGKDSSELKEKLDSMTKKLLESDAAHEPFQAIDVYWEIPSLHKNVVFVDTPGIGETDAMTKQVMKYVPDADGYIFVIDSVRAGGIQDGGIRKLIEIIAESTPKEEQITMLGNVFFLCNKWGLVEKEYRDDVMKNTRRKLSKFYGHLEGWQVVEFDSKLELKLLKWKANSSDAFSVLLQSLETLITRTIQQRLKKKQRWLLAFVRDVEGFMNSRMQTVHMKKETAEAQIHKVRKELDLATKELEQCNEVQKIIDSEKENLLEELRAHLKSDEIQSKLLDWTNSAPEQNQMRTKGPDLIKMRLQDVILKWASADKVPLKLASVSIRDKCMKIQEGIVVRIKAINKFELGLNLQESSDEYAIQNEERTFIIFAVLGIIGGLLYIILGRLLGIKDWCLSWFEERAKQWRIKQMTEMTKKATEELLTKDHLEKVITECFTYPHSNWLTKFKQDTQRKISSTHEVMLQMESDLEKKKDTLSLLQPLHPELQKCYKCLKELEK